MAASLGTFSSSPRAGPAARSAAVRALPLEGLEGGPAAVAPVGRHRQGGAERGMQLGVLASAERALDSVRQARVLLSSMGIGFAVDFLALHFRLWRDTFTTALLDELLVAEGQTTFHPRSIFAALFAVLCEVSMYEQEFSIQFSFYF